MLRPMLPQVNRFQAQAPQAFGGFNAIRPQLGGFAAPQLQHQAAPAFAGFNAVRPQLGGFAAPQLQHQALRPMLPWIR